MLHFLARLDAISLFFSTLSLSFISLSMIFFPSCSFFFLFRLCKYLVSNDLCKKKLSLRVCFHVLIRTVLREFYFGQRWIKDMVSLFGTFLLFPLFLYSLPFFPSFPSLLFHLSFLFPPTFTRFLSLPYSQFFSQLANPIFPQQSYLTTFFTVPLENI